MVAVLNRKGKSIYLVPIFPHRHRVCCWRGKKNRETGELDGLKNSCSLSGAFLAACLEPWAEDMNAREQTR